MREIDHPARPFELRRDLVGIELIDIDRAERADDAGEQRAAQQGEHDHGLARRRRQFLTKTSTPTWMPVRTPSAAPNFAIHTNM